MTDTLQSLNEPKNSRTLYASRHDIRRKYLYFTVVSVVYERIVSVSSCRAGRMRCEADSSHSERASAIMRLSRRTRWRETRELEPELHKMRGAPVAHRRRVPCQGHHGAGMPRASCWL